jgi:hypothetical protein
MWRAADTGDTAITDMDDMGPIIAITPLDTWLQAAKVEEIT